MTSTALKRDPFLQMLPSDHLGSNLRKIPEVNKNIHYMVQTIENKSHKVIGNPQKCAHICMHVYMCVCIYIYTSVYVYVNIYIPHRHDQEDLHEAFWFSCPRSEIATSLAFSILFTPVYKGSHCHSCAWFQIPCLKSRVFATTQQQSTICRPTDTIQTYQFSLLYCLQLGRKPHFARNIICF